MAKTAIVTGASSGIGKWIVNLVNASIECFTDAPSSSGRATAISLVQKGWNVSIVARRREELEITAGRCGGDRYPFSAKLRICVGDVTDEAFVKYVFEDAVKIFGE